MHSPKVPHPDFSVQVVRHNLKIFGVENFGRSLKTFDLCRGNAQPRKALRLGQLFGGATAGGKTGARLRQAGREPVRLRRRPNLCHLMRWFRRERGYQTRINAILSAYMQARAS